MRNQLIACALLLAATGPAGAVPQETALRTTCDAPEGAAAGAAQPELAGLWDFYMDVGGVPSLGLLSLGHIDGGYGGTVTPSRTFPVVVRSLTVADGKVRMVVGSREGDVIYNATLSGAGDRMCGVVTYHGGKLYPMVAQRRPVPASERR